MHGKDSKSPVGPDGYAALQQIVQARAIGLDPALLDVTAAWENDSNQRGSKVTVTVAYETRPVTTLFWSGLTLPPLTDSATMVVQN